MNWSATTTASWVSFDRSSGVGNSAISVMVSLAGLSAGNYLETITVSSPQAKNGSVQVDVQLNLAHGIPTAPTLISPENLSDLDTPSPEFTIGNAKDPEGSSLSYTIEVYKVGINRPLVVTSDIPEGLGGITTMIMDQTLEPDNTYEWRAKAVNSRKDSSPWSARWTFNVVKPAASGGCGCAAQDSTDGVGFIGLLGLLGLMRMAGFRKNQ
jgi:MYXO-CTERM domain-containing protein